MTSPFEWEMMANIATVVHASGNGPAGSHGVDAAARRCVEPEFYPIPDDGQIAATDRATFAGFGGPFPNLILDVSVARTGQG